MADPRDRDQNRDQDREDPGETASFWEDWFRRQEAFTAASAEQWRSLGEGWRDAVEGWWQQASARSPPEGREVLRQAADQGRSFFELADGVAPRSGRGRSVPGPRHPVAPAPADLGARRRGDSRENRGRWRGISPGIAGLSAGVVRLLRHAQRRRLRHPEGSVRNLAGPRRWCPEGCRAAESLRFVRGCGRAALPRSGVQRGLRRSRRPADQYPRRRGGRRVGSGRQGRRGGARRKRPG